MNVLAGLGGFVAGIVLYFVLLAMVTSVLGDQHIAAYYIVLTLGAGVGFFATMKAKMTSNTRIFFVAMAAAMLGISLVCDAFVVPALFSKP
jgi:hypothetical protein